MEMRALAILLPLLVLLVTPGTANADPPRPSVHLGANVTVAAAPSGAVVAVTRVEGLAQRALQPRVIVRSPVVRAIKLAPMWPLGAFLTVEYAVGRQ